jgi:amino acid adenylation domain-containing protein
MNGQIRQMNGLSVEEKRRLLAELLQRQALELKRFPLSFAQERLWFLTELDPEDPSYNVPVALRLSGDLDVVALEKSFDGIVERHETLRTTFAAVDGEPFQFVSSTATTILKSIDLPLLTEAEIETESRRLTREFIEQPFDLARDRPLRAWLIRFAPDDHLLLIAMHHIVSDAWSVNIFLQELSTLYKGFTTQSDSSLPELPIQYRDFAEWQRNWLQGESLDQQLTYWVSQLAGAAKLTLPADHARPTVRSYRGAHHSFTLSTDLTRKINELSKAEGVTIFMTLLAAFKVLLFRYTGEMDIVVGSPIAGRNRVETEKLIGFFVNSLALRTDLSGNPTFRQLVARVREVGLGAFAHQDLPFEKLVEELNPVRDTSQTPIFQVMFGVQNAPRSAVDLHNLAVKRVRVDSQTAKFDLTLLMTESANGLSGQLEYSADLFEAATIELLQQHFENLLTSIIANPDARIAALPLLGAREQQQVLIDWNTTETAYPRAQCIHHLFEEQALRRPNDVAVIFNDRKMTYGELNGRANQLAHYLRKQGVGPDVIVGLAVDRSFEMIVGLLGILKAGGAYLPIDGSYPHERLLFMTKQAGVKIILSQKHLIAGLPSSPARLIALDDDNRQITSEAEQNLQAVSEPENLAYVMYTSGSTGQPKGVSITHRNVVRLVKETNYARFGADEVFLQFAPVTFDAATFEIWGALLNGARLVVTTPGIESLESLGQTIQRHGVTTLWLTAGLFHQMVDTELNSLSGVRQLLAGGDVLSLPHVEKVAKTLTHCRLVNGYGPTENTTFTCCETLNTANLGRSVSIGRPVSNTQVYVLSRELEPVPVGVAGELFAGGDGLARGYLNDPAATAERFVPNPFAVEPGERLYRTGDQVRHRRDGSIEFLGRLDQQVKIRGYRIELGDIEFALLQHAEVKECVVTTQTSRTGERRLAAFVVPHAGQTPSREQLKAFLSEKLPEYMVPSFTGILESLPLTTNGKIDRQALPNADDFNSDRSSFAPPQTEVERKLADVWMRVLGLDKVGIHDNFFNLGGHSLLAVKLVNEIKKEFEQKVPLISFFQSATIAGLASALSRGTDSQSWPTLVQIQEGRSPHALFCVSAPNVNALGYVSLVRSLGPEQRAFGLQAQFPADAETEHSQFVVENLAGEYLQALQAEQPHGPYHLIGMCRGAHIAYEMAIRLQEQGERVALLGILDTFVMENTYNYFWYVEHFVNRFGFWLRLPAKAKFDFISSRWRKALPKRRSPDNLLRQVYFPGADFNQKTYQGRISVFRVSKQPRNRISDSRLGWGKLAEGGVDVRVIPGTHETLLREPHVRELANVLREFIHRPTAPNGNSAAHAEGITSVDFYQPT